MKIFELTSAGTPTNLDEVIRAIRRDCKPFLSQSKRRQLFRGTARKKSDWFEAYPRTNRRPLNSPKPMTENFNELIRRAGLTANRTNSFFVTTDFEQAINYADGNGDILHVFPNGTLRFTWSTQYDDWFNHFEEVEHVSMEHGNDLMDAELEILFESLKGNDDSFSQALESGHEIMIQNHCYFINMDLVSDKILEKIYEGF